MHAFFDLGGAIADEALASLSQYLTEHINRFCSSPWHSGRSRVLVRPWAFESDQPMIQEGSATPPTCLESSGNPAVLAWGPLRGFLAMPFRQPLTYSFFPTEESPQNHEMEVPLDSGLRAPLAYFAIRFLRRPRSRQFSAFNQNRLVTCPIHRAINEV